MVNDRLYALSNPQGNIASGKNTRRFRKIDGLFSLIGKLTDDGVAVEFPDGLILKHKHKNLNTKLSQTLGQVVSVTKEAEISHFDDGAIHILTSSSITKLQKALPNSNIDERRFRANIIIDLPADLSDDDLIGKIINIDDVKLKITHKTQRCRMVTLEQGDLNYKPEILKEIYSEYGLDFGIYACVISPGTITLNSVVTLESD